MFNEHTTPIGELLAADFQKLAELLDRRVGDGQGCQRFAREFHEAAVLLHWSFGGEERGEVDLGDPRRAREKPAETQVGSLLTLRSVGPEE